MSTAIERRTLKQAIDDASAFRSLFSHEQYIAWFTVGSVRRQVRHVGDIEHVVIPREGDKPSNDLFRTPETVNLLWHRLEQHQQAGLVAKHIYGDTGFRWGPKYRGVDFRGFTHEIFLADADNLGSVLAIRTGPGTYSRMLVTQLQQNGYMNSGGYVLNKNDWNCPACGWRGVKPVEVRGALPGGFVTDPEGRQSGPTTATCPACGPAQYGPAQVVTPLRVPAPDEETYFRLCGVKFIPPEQRFDVR